LRAKLDKVAIVRFASAALVFDWKGVGAKLDDIGAAGEAETSAAERQTTNGVEIVPPRLPGKIGFLMENPTFRRETILCPCLLKVDQRPLTRTEGKMLQSAQRQSAVELLFSKELRSRRSLLE
jgi:hypothetical protein